MYEIMICPLKKLYQYAEDGDMRDVAVLAVSSYDINQERLKVFGKTLCLNFDDVTDTVNSSAFTKDIAEKIADYVKEFSPQTDTLFVCCDSGESRSTAMAAAIMRFNGMDEMNIWKNPHYHPNTLVYSLLCDALGVPVSKTELQEKHWTSEKALSDAINQRAYQAKRLVK
ncbi:MAG: hypothetical protein ACI4RM_03220 [Ruminococcus sp.]